jgi:5-methyltetrahydropteroyltriglutamate--homocysteine methyltransferase
VTDSGTPHRADQVGSFLRPPALLALRGGGVSDAVLREAEDVAIAELLHRQAATGIGIFTDGEFRRASFLGDFTSAVDGFEPVQPRGSTDIFGSASRATLAVARPLAPRRRLARSEAEYLKRHAPGPFKLALPSPFQFVNYVAGVTERAYATPLDLLGELARIVADEAAALLSEGVNYLQIDAPRYSYFIDADLAARFKARGLDPGVSLEQVITADNLALGVKRPPGTTTALHLCRGNARSSWYAEGGYDAIAERLFNTLQADRFLLEYDDARSGSFAPLRFVPPGRTVVLGLITTKFDALESQVDLLHRIDAAAKYLPLEQLALSPQCGFASLMEGNTISPETQWRKLELVVDTARRVWG